MIVLRWKGEGFVPGIPAKDLTAEDVENSGGMDRVLSTGLYEPVEKKKKRRHANKALDPLRENKSAGSNE